MGPTSIVTNFLLVAAAISSILLPVIVHSHNHEGAAATVSSIHATRIDNAFAVLGHDFGPIKELYAQDALVKFCFQNDCSEGSVDAVLRPYHKALSNFKIKTSQITHEQQDYVSLYWSNYMETPLGCSEVTSGVAILEFNQQGQVTRHLSLSDDAMRCIPEYHEAVSLIF